MPDLPAPTAADAALQLLRETFEGPAGPSTQFLDNDAKAGFLAAMADLNADEASRPTRPGGTTIAGHVNHVAFGLEVSEAAIRGDRAPRDWSESWTPRSVDGPAWSELQRELRRRFDALVATVTRPEEEKSRDLETLLGAIAHSAYHLGAVRQAIAARALAGAASDSA